MTLRERIESIKARLSGSVTCPWCHQQSGRKTGKTVAQSRRGPLYQVVCSSCGRDWFKRQNRKTLPHVIMEGLIRLEGNTPIKFEDWQVRILEDAFDTLNASGVRLFRTVLIMVGKKSGKSTTSAAVASYMLHADSVSDYMPECYVVSNSKSQSQDTVLRKVKQMHTRNGALAGSVLQFRDEVKLKSNGGYIRAVSSFAPPQHGLDPSFVCCDEVWAWGHDYSVLEALSFSPSRDEPLLWICSYAGSDQSPGAVLWDFYNRGKSGADDQAYFVHFEGRSPSPRITDEYLSAEKRRLPTASYQRMHLCQWVTSSDTFLTIPEVQSCICHDLRNEPFSTEHAKYFLSVDLGVVHDATVISVCHIDNDGHAIVDHQLRIVGSVENRISIEKVEATMEELIKNFPRVIEVICDSWQMENSVQRFSARGIKVTRFVFTPASHCKITEAILQYVREKRLHIPASCTALIHELTNCYLETSSSGYSKIEHNRGEFNDCVIGLGMSLVSAIEDHKQKATKQPGTVRAIIGVAGRTVTTGNEQHAENEPRNGDRPRHAHRPHPARIAIRPLQSVGTTASIFQRFAGEGDGDDGDDGDDPRLGN